MNANKGEMWESITEESFGRNLSNLRVEIKNNVIGHRGEMTEKERKKFEEYYQKVSNHKKTLYRELDKAIYNKFKINEIELHERVWIPFIYFKYKISIIEIYPLEDEWFYVSLHSGVPITQKYFKCDQLSGLEELFRLIKIYTNIKCEIM